MLTGEVLARCRNKPAFRVHQGAGVPAGLGASNTPGTHWIPAADRCRKYPIHPAMLTPSGIALYILEDIADDITA